MFHLAGKYYLIGCVNNAGSYRVDGMSGSKSAFCMIAGLFLLLIRGCVLERTISIASHADGAIIILGGLTAGAGGGKQQQHSTPKAFAAAGCSISIAHARAANSTSVPKVKVLIVVL